jgi:hypothetical protein
MTHSRPRTASSFDHLVGAQHDRRRHFETERPCGLQIDNELELGRLLYRQVGGLGAIQKAINIEPANTDYDPGPSEKAVSQGEGRNTPHR